MAARAMWGLRTLAVAVAVPRIPSWLHAEAPLLLRSMLALVLGGCFRCPRLPSWRIWRAGEVPGETPGWRGSLPKVDAFGADPLPEGFGVDPLPSASSSSYGESFCSPGLGVDGTLVSCSFLKAAAGNSSWWRGCWWRGGGATSAFYLVLCLGSRDQRTVSLVEQCFIHTLMATDLDGVVQCRFGV